MPVNRKGGRWAGGYVSLAADGTRTYIIEREVQGERFHISTRCHSDRAAMKQLERFEADPRAYRDGGGAAGTRTEDGLYLTETLVLEYRAWMLNREHPATSKHANDMAHRLADWMEDIGSAELRRVTLRDHLKPALERRATSRQHRIIAIKGFYGWLRREKMLLTSAQDPTLDLEVPQAKPEKHRRKKAVPFANVKAALQHLVPAYRDCLLLLANTGWHVTELERFARDAASKIAPGREHVLGVLQVLHKTGEVTRTPVIDADVLVAAERIRARGEVPRRLNEAIALACRAAHVDVFGAGVMRHSVATWAIEAGTPPDVVAEFLGHKSKRTTLKFYADVAVPTQTIKLPKFGGS